MAGGAREKENRAGAAWAAGQDSRLKDRVETGGSYGAEAGGYGGMGREEGKAMDRERERLREVENRERGGVRLSDTREREAERERAERAERERERESRGSAQLAMMAPPAQPPAASAPTPAVAKRDRFIVSAPIFYPFLENEVDVVDSATNSNTLL